ncbi:unnamed protein product [Ectocarpus sp. CCAP 1310/34]|nr:unnamed protein product [Ectocarpus sp. CCAP 1310/34]
MVNRSFLLCQRWLKNVFPSLSILNDIPSRLFKRGEGGRGPDQEIRNGTLLKQRVEAQEMFSAHCTASPSTWCRLQVCECGIRFSLSPRGLWRCVCL